MPPSATEEDRVENRLADEPSPYLRQHRTNPVDWYPWGEEAFEKARSEEKPIFLSIGYSSCHWCHVMAHESFEDEEIAEILNEHFVSVKVDREERPDVDGLYMEFVQRATGQGGWPLSVFLLPDGRPFYGGTYFPPEDRYGTPGFKNVVTTLAEHWEEDRERLLESAEEVAEGLQVDVFDRSSGGEATEEVLSQAVSALAESFDPRNGGFGEAPKFPQPMVLSFLLREYHRTGDPNARQMALTTLDAMARGGIYDHLGGGFHRYATDAEWLVPHFEKMGYDNALLTGLYLEAYQLTGEERYRSVVEETLAFVERAMRDPEGGIFTALDADSEGEEGKYYVWTYEELVEELHEAVGSEAAEAVAAYFGARPEGNWEGTNILHRPEPAEAVADRFDCTEEELEAYAAEAADHLREKRSKRPAPGLDDKVLTAWNGMMITSFARAAEVLGEDRYRETAVETAEFLFDRLYDEEADQLYRAYRDGQVRQEAFVEDYAYLAEALVALYETTGARRWLDRAGELAEEMVEAFADTENGGFFLTRSDTELIARRKEIMDNAMPSGNSKAVQVLLRLATLLGREDWAEQARRTLDQLAPAMERHPVGFGGLLQGVQEAIEPYREIVLVGPDREPFTEALRGRYEPFRVLVQADGPEADGIPLLEGRSMEQGRTTAYLCENYSCRLPVTDPEALIDQLEERAERS